MAGVGDGEGGSVGPGEGQEAPGAGRGLRSHGKGSTTPQGQWESEEGLQPQEIHAFLPVKRMTPVTIWREPENQRQETLARGPKAWSRLGI